MTRSLICLCLLLPSTLSAQTVRPNFLIIVADDVGMAELGPFGGEIDTPALDALAEKGIRFTSFYAQMNCSPTRAMLLSGTDNHLAGLGTMGAGMQSPNQEGVPGYEGVLSDRVVTFAKLLQANGYRTYTTGKWHLGHSPDKLPVARGFDRSFIQTGGGPADSHFNLDTRPGAMGGYFEDEVEVTGMPVAEGFFSSDFYADTLIDYMRSDPDQDKPFLAYLNFTAPHIPVQAPDSHIDLYRGRYDDGYDALREVRLAAMIELGLFPPGTELAERAPTVTPWTELSDAARSIHARRMEVYAGVIDNMDDNIGRVIEYLEQEGLYENTVVLFMSDNGAAGFFGYNDGPAAERYAAADNGMENLGREGSDMFYGPGWGSAGSVPFNLFKRHAAEGGIRVPAIVSAPGIADGGGAISHSVLMVSDVAPTVLELAGVEYPQGTYDGREILPQTGESFVPLLHDPDAVVHGDDEVLGLELWSRIAVRKGDWKLLKTEPPFREDRWYLYNVRSDPGETTDLANQMPGKLEEMMAAWELYRERNNVLLPQFLPDMIRPMWLIDGSPHPDPMP